MSTRLLTLSRLCIWFAVFMFWLSSCSATNWTIYDLQTLKFPYIQSNDKYMDPCKAKGFLDNDIALSDEDFHSYPVLRTSSNEVQSVAGDLRIAAKGGVLQIQTLAQHSHSAMHESNHDSDAFASRGLASETAGLSARLNRRQHRRRRHRKTNRRKQGRRLRTDGHERSTGRSRRAATARTERIWNFGVIPYEIQSNFSGEMKTLFQKAMRHWENYTCITFVEKTPEDRNYIVFTVAECGCCSYVGKRGDGPQAISIGKNCDKFGIVVHELGHVIGFWHEHTRPDREQYVDIYYKNIQPGQEYNFEKLKSDDVNSLGQAYDYASIMHYARDTFSKGMFLDTILPKSKAAGSGNDRPEIGQRIRLSPGDITQANLLYKCPSCGGTLMETSGAFDASMHRAAGVEASVQICQWRIIASHGESVQLNITALDLPAGGGENCSQAEHYLEIRDGHYVLSPLIRRFCGRLDQPETVISTGSRMWIGYRHTPPLLGSNTLPYDETQDRPEPYNGFSATYQIVCGGDVAKDTGMLQSPNYPHDYRSDQDCLWRITVPEDYQVALIFDHFEIEKHEECLYDYLEVRDGHTLDAPLIGKYCGYTVPTNVKSTGNRILVRFVSDSSVEKPGFFLHFIKEFDECKTNNHGCAHKCVNTLGNYRCECNIGFELNADGKRCEDACGGYIHASNGTLSSPNFPNFYPSKKRCVWEIEANPLYRITMNFTHLDMEGTQQNCEYDYVEVTSVNNDGTVAKKHGRYCGMKAREDKWEITSETSHLRIEFKSDNSVQKSGFAAIFYTDRDECQVNNGDCEQVCHNTIGSYECSCESGYVLVEDQHHCKEGGCKFEMNAPSGLLSSPNYPEEYYPNRECIWHFVTTPGHRIQIEFLDFEIEPHQECTYDRVELYDGSSLTSRSLGKYCGPKAPEKLTTTRNQLLMIFHSDNSVQRKGFNLRYNSVCGGILYAERMIGNVYSHAQYGGANYGNKAACDWVISAKDGFSVELRFTNFELEFEPNCDYDFVEIFDGADDSAPRFERNCGNKMPMVVVSSGDTLLLRFRADDTINAKGFVAEYFLTEPVEKTGDDLTQAVTTTRRPLEPVINEKANNVLNKHRNIH